MENAQSRTSVKKYAYLLFSPVVVLIVVVLLQLIARFAFASTYNLPEPGLEAEGTSGAQIVKTILDLISVLLGTLAIIMLLLAPLWLILLLRNLKAPQRSKTVAVVLAVIFGLFTWIYTFEKDATKFWINLGLSIITIGLWLVVAWVWAIIDTAIKPDEYYTNYGVGATQTTASN